MKCSLNRFTEFLRSRKYSEQTIALYLNELDKIDIIDFNSPDELAAFIDLAIKNAKSQGFTKSHIDNLRAGLHQLFFMSFGITIKEYQNQNRIKDYLDTFLDEFFDYSINFKSQKISTALSERSHISVFLKYIGFDDSYDFSQ